MNTSISEWSDIYDGAPWTEMHIKVLKALIDDGSPVEEAAQFFAARAPSTKSNANVKSWG
jgi:hypothetical protein